MFRYVALFYLVSCAFAGTVPNVLDGRIVNGEPTTIEAHPYQVSMQMSGRHICGGSLISEDIVVTAAHCVQSPSTIQMKVRAGSTEYNTGGEVVGIRAYKFHPGYNPDTMVNDVAVLKLDSPIRESSRVRYIKLAEKTPHPGTEAVVTGWGVKCSLICFTNPTVLQEVKLYIVSLEECRSSMYKYGDDIMKTMLCAYSPKKDACQGDSGGPLVAENRLVGVVSWGHLCARDGYPGVYCDVADVRPWIVETAAKL